MKNIGLFVCGIAIVLSACTREVELDPINETETEDPGSPTPMSDVPSITLDEVSATTVTQYADPIYFTVSYQDGDGDLGFEDADSLSLWLIDERDPDNLIQKYHIPPLAPIGSDVSIKGTFEIELERTAILDEDNTTETTTFTIKMKDRAGNWSNEVVSATITINS